MKFTLDNPQGNYTFSNYGSGFLTINDQQYNESVVIFPDEIFSGWPVNHATDLKPEHFEIFRSKKPDIVLLGTGARQQFPDIALRRELQAMALPLEVMDTAAACRTYNLLVSEGRDVGAAIMVFR
ncbi:hypothetical protein AB833_07095 [Chromatiales bacterium (ex Bugula neritina AB1)]|nr:hypothetical protein AB833_07095 [Chromatiales bacterium (ex Bugula neritina AB1)]